MTEISGGPVPQFPADPSESAPQAWSPPRTRRKLVGVLGPVLVIALAAVGYLAVRQNTIAGQWRARERSEVAQNAVLAMRLHAADASIASLNSTVTGLNGKVGRLQSQLSAVADAKEKALDENAVLTQLNQEADGVSQQLSTCVQDLSEVLSEVSADISEGIGYDPELSGTVQTASDDCATAETDNNELQTTLDGAG